MLKTMENIKNYLSWYCFAYPLILYNKSKCFQTHLFLIYTNVNRFSVYYKTKLKYFISFNIVKKKRVTL